MGYTRRKNGTIIGAKRPVSTTVSTNGAKSVPGRRILNRVVDSGKGKQGGRSLVQETRLSYGLLLALIPGLS